MPANGLAARDVLKLDAFRLASALAGHAPHLALQMARIASTLAYWCNRGGRAAVHANLRVLLPNAPAEAIERDARQVFRSAARYFVDVQRLPRRDIRALHARMRVEGYEHFLAAQSEGRGVIIAGIHQGPAEVVLQAISARGVRYTAMVERLEPPPLAALLKRLRESHGDRYVYPDLAGARALRQALRGGGAVALLVDRDVVGNGIAAGFCGRMLRAPAGHIELAAAVQAPIVPAVSAWLPDGRYYARFLPPLHANEQSGRSRRRGDGAQLRADVERLLAAFEPFLKARPGQWLVLQRLWPASAGADKAGAQGGIKAGVVY